MMKPIIAIFIVCMYIGVSPAFAQSTTCTTLYNTTTCNTYPQNQGGGGLGAFARGFQDGQQRTQQAQPPAQPAPSIPAPPIMPPVTTAVDPNAPFELVCRINNGGPQQDINLHVDPTKKYVNAHPATIGEDQIRYETITERGWLKIKVHNEIVINRITGTFTAIGERGELEALGACVRATARAF